MFLESISLQNFRNYTKTEFVFSPLVTLIIGPNTAGKTNILEAIYLLATGGSFRAGRDEEMIRTGEELARVACEVDKGSEEILKKLARAKFFKRRDEVAGDKVAKKIEKLHLEIVLTVGAVGGRRAPYKKYLVNGIGRRKSVYLGNFYAVLFNPQDIELITDSPSRRRRFLDNVLVQASREYARSLTEYEKALRRRNKILSQLQEQLYNRVSGDSQIYNNIQEQLEYWDRFLIENGRIITEKRREFITFLNKAQISTKTIHVYQFGRNSDKISSLNRKEFKFKLAYENSCMSAESLKKYADREIAAGHTLIGPHRDDFVVKIQNPNIKIQSNIKYQMSNIKISRAISAYGSRGEQRLAVLWLKLGELAYLTKETGEKPILLLDDIFSELDHEYRELVTSLIPEYQTIITTADKHYVEGLLLEDKRGIKLIKLND